MKNYPTSTPLIFILAGFVLLSCSNKNEGYSANSNGDLNTENLPEEIRNLENLSVYTFPTDGIKELQFNEEQQFGELYRPSAPPAPSIGFGPKIAVDKNGTVYFSNYYQNNIEVYSKDGTLVHTIGRNGRGPGEFNSISASYINNNQLIVFDGNLQRIQFFDIDSFELIQSFVFEPADWELGNDTKSKHPGTMLPLSNSLLTAVPLNEENEQSSFGYFKVNEAGDQTSEILTKTLKQALHTGTNKKFGYTTSLPMPTSNKEIIQTSDRLIYKINTQDFLIRIYNSEGEYLRAFYYPFKNDPVEKEEVLAEFHPNMHSVFDNAEFPEIWPALTSFFVDEEHRIWVSTIIDDHTVNQWYVLEGSGKLIGTFSWPVDQPVLFVRNGKMYTNREDSATEAKSIVRYGIQW